MKEVLLKTAVEKFFDSLSVRLSSEKVAGVNMSVKITFTDLNESYL
jgi:alkyl sulfatase BDS1-like metallo-beta-lactamase superfamily hydrolase